MRKCLIKKLIKLLMLFKSVRRKGHPVYKNKGVKKLK